MKHAVLKALFLVGAMAGASNAETGKPQTGSEPITVSGERITLADWSGDFSRKLERNLSYPVVSQTRWQPSGVVSVSFQCGEDGRPAAVAVLRKSGNAELDRAAVRAVSRIKTLHPMPESFTANQKFRANILFATSQYDHDRQIKQLREEAKAGNAWFNDDPDVIALTIGSRAAARS